MGDVDPTLLLQAAAGRVRDPVSGRSVWMAEMVRSPRSKGDDLHVELVFQAAHSPEARETIRKELASHLTALGMKGRLMALDTGATPGLAHAHERPKDPVPGMTGAGVAPHGGPIAKKRVEGVRHVILVASGKGGVGKSTVSANLAVGLAQLGYGAGLLDADVHGPSAPILLGDPSRPAADPVRKKILPVVAHGVRMLSMGQLVSADEAMIWRGPMVMGAVRQFVQDADWEGLDYLIIDLPPGTGDAQLTLLQAVDGISGAVIVTTPQEVALADARRGVTMFRKLDLPLLGLVENMAWYELPDGTRDPVFGDQGGLRLAAEVGTQVLAQIPLQTAIRLSCDVGVPVVLSNTPTGRAFMDLARQVAALLP